MSYLAVPPLCHVIGWQVYMAALESENKTLRTALGLDTM